MTQNAQDTGFQHVYGQIIEGFIATEEAHQRYQRSCKHTDDLYSSSVKRMEAAKNEAIAQAEQARQRKLKDADSTGKGQYKEADYFRTKHEEDLKRGLQLLSSNLYSAQRDVARVGMFHEQLLDASQVGTIFESASDVAAAVEQSNRDMKELRDLCEEYLAAQNREGRVRTIIVVAVVAIVLIVAVLVLFPNSAAGTVGIILPPVF